MITVWPQYLDKNLSLNEGRKVSKEIAVEEPKLQDIEKALKRLNLHYSTQKKGHILANGMKNQDVS